jgi:2-polyprenyl-3-methyl-5-hydroxy-6-metoxy-1,4-benzoquinol methylase
MAGCHNRLLYLLLSGETLCTSVSRSFRDVFEGDNVSGQADGTPGDALRIATADVAFTSSSRMACLISYYQWVLGMVEPYIGDRVLDAGCGLGNAIELIRKRAKFVVGIDCCMTCVEIATDRFRDDPKIKIVAGDIQSDAAGLGRESFDTVLCLDVLEHIEDDLQQLRRLRDLVSPGGHLIIKVPAGPWLYGSIDVASGHFRRYTLQSLRSAAQEAGWEVVALRYMNLAGVLPYWMKSRVMRRQVAYSATYSCWQLHVLKRAMPFARFVDWLSGAPVGQSAILVARRKTVSM